MKMIYLVGQPGSGKTTLMSRLTASLSRVPTDSPIPHDVLADMTTGAEVGAEIGRRRGVFSGTDALSSTVIEKAEPWIRSGPYPLVLAEGARLGNARFLRAAREHYDVILALLDHTDAEDWRHRRSEQLGRTQNEAWVRGRRTAGRNLADVLAAEVTVMRGHPDDLYPELAWTVDRFRRVQV